MVVMADQQQSRTAVSITLIPFKLRANDNIIHTNIQLL